MKDTGNWISTQLVPKFYFLEPRQEDIRIADIARALSFSCRFGGHGRHFYSVGEHSVLLSFLVEFQGGDLITQRAGLLHDAEEAYLPDIPRPIKTFMPEAKRLYSSLNSAIVEKFQLQGADWDLIASIDTKMCVEEAKELGLWNEHWYNPYTPEESPLEVPLFLWDSRTSQLTFLIRYLSLTKGENNEKTKADLGLDSLGDGCYWPSSSHYQGSPLD